MALNIFGAAVKNSGLVLSGAALMSANLIIPWEGVRYKPYRDIGGVLTVCYGHTGSDIIMDKVYTKQECKALVDKDIVKHEAEVDRFIKVDMPVSYTHLTLPTKA